MTTFLRFPDENAAKTILAQWYSSDYGWYCPSDGQAIDIIGSISIGGEWDSEGNVVTPLTQLEGWHINILGDVPEEALPYVVTPTTPFRIFAGY
jgi:hypothetical protein